MTRRTWAVAAAPGRVAVAAVALALAALAGCAPRPTAPVSVTAGDRRERFERARGAREAAVMAEMTLTMWPHAASGAALPGFDAVVAMAPPSAFRFRVASLFGTAIDLAARGDSIVAWVPSRREGAALDTRVDPVGVHAPGRFGVWLFAGDWSIPEAAWTRATWQDSLLNVRWLEGADSLGVTLGAAGLPRRARVWQQSADGIQGLEVAYGAWQRAGNADWPADLEVRDLAGRLTVRSRVDRVRVTPRVDPARLMVSLPPGAHLVAWDELSRRLRRIMETTP